jgi:phosphoglycolate phosphatase-like HAD superfamily hydrolase
MTSTQPELAAVLGGTRSVLLDFDGPVSPIFANGVNAAVAEQMRAALVREGVTIPDQLAQDYNPVHVLQFAAGLSRPELAALAEDVFRHGEVEAAQQAVPTIGAHAAIHACHDAGRGLVIVSNNYAGAIKVYLQAHDLAPYVQAVIGRAYARPDLMKPHLAIQDDPPELCVLVGDSLTDIEVAHKTGVRSIGYAKSPDRLPDCRGSVHLSGQRLRQPARASRGRDRSRRRGVPPRCRRAETSARPAVRSARTRSTRRSPPVHGPRVPRPRC